ncbi:uncharacterized protein GGS22DRAFT_194854 [Annulohypoxylon maeteangense]|uniref:uncharacterized protein n=1 Tax=Annulohypoxylon maeteangense TaxID=1927788 RepID=UPI00200849B7|nr:uncharacterized protein GGS22DRAFT_194854 [Annulohypoxylon maeteangense]KAI0884323.1 hypothetical protein GGS22DRAFT_194854 [Annulohypoxylon maeteangense]
MVGKVWSDLEERYFWRTAVAHSSKRAGIDKANGEKTWDQLAYEMHRAMERLGHIRRKYTSTMLFEHYFQNIEGERRSPNAAAYVNEYLRKVGPTREIVNPRAVRPRREVKKQRARKAPPPPTPTESADGPQDDKDDNATVEPTSLPTLREMDLPDPRPFILPRPGPGLSERRSFQPSRPLRPLAKAATRMLPPSPLVSPSYEGLSYANQRDAALGWNLVSPAMTSPYGAPQYQPRTPMTPGSGNKEPEEPVWGYQMGKRSATLKPSPQEPSKSQKTSANGYATRRQYSDSSEMGLFIPEKVDTPSVAFSRATDLLRLSSESSFADAPNPQRELSVGYQFKDYSSPTSMSTAYSSVPSQSPALTQAASEQSVESTLFVEDVENIDPYVDDDVDERVDEEAEESGDDIREAGVKYDTDVHTVSYRDFRKREIMNWRDEGPGYGDVGGGEYYSGLDHNI